MRHRGRLSASERAARSRMSQLLHEGRFVCGSLVRMHRVCGNPGCKCARGEKHPALCLAMRVDDKRKMLHIPKAWEETITSWVENYQELKSLMDQISQENLKHFMEEKKRPKARKGSKATTKGKARKRKGSEGQS